MSFFDFLNRKNANTARKKAEKAALQGGKRAYLLNEETPFTVTEAFRNLKMTLSVSLARQHDGTGASFLCTSSYPSEGKTTVAANTALMLAQSNVKVVLVDTDLRAGRLSKFFNVPHAPGLSDYLSGQATLEEVLRPTEISPNLFVICRGTQTVRPYELLAADVMKDLNLTLKKRFAYTIYDSPPFRLVSDALAVAPIANGTFLVTRYKYSYQSDIRAAVDALKFVKANLLGIVVNDYKPEKFAKKESRYTQYYYSGYYSDAPQAPQKETDKNNSANA